MPGFVAKMENFGGTIPAIDDRLLPENHATVARNTWLFSGRIEPTHSVTFLHQPKPETRSWFRLPKSNSDIDNMADSHWLEFENQDIRVIRSPVAGQDDNGRYYWADGVAPKYMTGDDIAAGNPPLKLGVPIPSVPPTVTTDGGDSTVQTTRAYAYLWVTKLGEQGPPSLPTLHVGQLDDIWHIGVFPPTASDMADRQLDKTRIFRTVTSAQGVATFYFVAEIPITQLVFDDDISDPAVAANEQLTSLFWTAPPTDLQGLVSMPNGMVAGWRNNEVWFAEPYYPHAWPITYVIAVPTLIVGLGVLGQSLIILTDGHAWSATGVDPASMALAIIQPLEPCTSRNSIVNTPNGVLYSSPNGLINVTPGGAENITLPAILKDQWDGLLNLGTIAASVIMKGYYAYSLPEQGVFQADSFQTDAFQQPRSHKKMPGAYLSLLDTRLSINTLDPMLFEVQNVMTDLFNGETMVMRDGAIYLVDIRKQTATDPYVWRSKIWVMPYIQNLGAAKIYWTPAFDDDRPSTIFRMYAGLSADFKDDGLPLKYQRQLLPSGTMFRLPSGFKALYFQFEVEGFSLINSIHVAQSPRDLRDI